MSYFLRGLTVSAIMTPVYLEYDRGSSELDALWIALIILSIVYAMTFVVLPRCRDLDGGWGMALLCLVPVAIILIGWSLLFARSHPVALVDQKDDGVQLQNPWSQSDAKIGMRSEPSEGKTEAQPGATDNPDDAQRLREDC